MQELHTKSFLKKALHPSKQLPTFLQLHLLRTLIWLLLRKAIPSLRVLHLLTWLNTKAVAGNQTGTSLIHHSLIRAVPSMTTPITYGRTKTSLMPLKASSLGLKKSQAIKIASYIKQWCQRCKTRNMENHTLYVY